MGWGVGGWLGGGPGHYVVTPTRVEVELGCDNTLLRIAHSALCSFNICLWLPYCKLKEHSLTLNSNICGNKSKGILKNYSNYNILASLNLTDIFDI